MNLNAPSSPHIHSGNQLSTLMQKVLLALLPGIAVYISFFGWGIVVNILIAVIAALVFEAVVVMLRKRPVGHYLGDYSAVLTAVLLALSLPPLAPWWLIVVGVFFAIVFAKHLYGGLGFNPFNPAMIGYVVLLISFPREVTNWLPPDSVSQQAISFMDALQASVSGAFSNGITADAISMATPLDHLKTQLHQSHPISEIINSGSIFGSFAGLGWEWISITFLLGGCWLIYEKVIHWHIHVAMLGSLTIISGLFWLIDPESYASPLFHLLSGGVMLGAFFIATDPVTASTTNKGRILFGIGIGLLVYIIRTWGGYPEGVAFAVLLMNMLAPTLDYYTQPKVFGRGGNK